jgi:hypothetical protein
MADTDAGVEGNGVRKGDEAVIIHRPRHKVDQQHSLNATKLTPPPPSYSDEKVANRDIRLRFGTARQQMVLD